MTVEPKSTAWQLMERALLATSDAATPQTDDQRADLDRSASAIEEALDRLGVPWTVDHLDGAAMMFMAASSLSIAENLDPIEAFGRVGIWLVQNQDRIRVDTTT